MRRQHSSILAWIVAVANLRSRLVSETHTQCGRPACPWMRENDLVHGPYVQPVFDSGGESTTRCLSAERAAVLRAEVDESSAGADSPANSSAVSEQLSDACRASADPAVRQWARKSQRARVCPRHLGRDCALRSSRCGRCGRLRGPGEPPAAASAKAGGTGGRVSWRDYGQGMDQRLTDRCKVSSWECIAPPAQPMHIPKPDGGERQLDIGAREDRIDR